MALAAHGYINQQIERKRWIYDLINGLREQECVRYDCDDYMILPDAEAQNSGRVLNWLVVFKDLRLRSVRDLRGARDGPMLRTLRDQLNSMFLGMQTTTMFYFHAPPSVWQLHLHIASPCDLLRTTNDMQKVQFLDDVISNIEIDSDYYAKATLTYVLPAGHELIRLYGSGSRGWNSGGGGNKACGDVTMAGTSSSSSSSSSSSASNSDDPDDDVIVAAATAAAASAVASQSTTTTRSPSAGGSSGGVVVLNGIGSGTYHHNNRHNNHHHHRTSKGATTTTTTTNNKTLSSSLVFLGSA
jgi:Scavenger mRNA decapping enzyme C-term binding